MAARPRSAKRRNWPVNLYQNGAGYFYFRDPESKKDFGLGRDQAKAFQEARVVNAEIARRTKHTSLLDRIRKPNGKTLAQWAPEYLKAYEDNRAPTAKTMQTVKSGVRAALAAPFASKDLPAITTKDVAEYIATAVQERGANMAKLIRKTLLDMFREAETVGLIENGKNPVSVTRTPKFDVERSRLTLDQFQAVYAAALKLEPWVARCLELALLTGQRREDIAGLQFADATEGFLHVIQSKTGAKLRIPLSIRLDVLNMTLDECIKRARDAVVSKSILHYSRRNRMRKAGTPVRADALTKVFQELREDAELTWEDGKNPATFHELRSLSARLYTEQYGEDLAQVIMGHKTAAMTEMYRDTRGAEWVEVRVSG
ncbi:tyrosine-type recombinase/integrase [Cupriavidus numazuensis]|uniref:Integrase n=1 Tax=Cupriavidus numazuensis TaxID=221992 RepID=A0ABM8TBQ8_9BURK|nr:tyrosine-type recombinase/integrase [Cupriavidus numazuensis]CAG2132151.1 hypothetical protein LMG26411_00566 [Cupriavidus numazuensis]